MAKSTRLRREGLLAGDTVRSPETVPSKPEAVDMLVEIAASTVSAEANVACAASSSCAGFGVETLQVTEWPEDGKVHATISLGGFLRPATRLICASAARFLSSEWRLMLPGPHSSS